MGQQVCMGALLKCSMAMPPGISSLTVLPANRVLSQNMPAANIMDHKPMVNILTFGMCTSQLNPQVALATIAALGTPTPMPCIPATFTPWTPGNPQVMIANIPTVTNSSKLMCSWGGVIQVNFAGQATVNA